MDLIQVVAAVGLPVAMAAGAFAAWRKTRHAADGSAPGWRDDSLDEWREERKRTIEAERAGRESERRDGDG